MAGSGSAFGAGAAVTKVATHAKMTVANVKRIVDVLQWALGG